MKNIYIFLLLFVAIVHNGNAQVDGLLNVNRFFGRGIGGGVDFALSHKFSVEGNIGYRTNSNNSSFRLRDVPITLYGKYYTNPVLSADRLYIMGAIRRVGRSTEWLEVPVGQEYSDFDQEIIAIGFGVGYKFVTEYGLVVDVNGGLNRSLVSTVTFDDQDLAMDTPVFSDNSVLSYRSLPLNIRIGLGYRFKW